MTKIKKIASKIPELQKLTCSEAEPMKELPNFEKPPEKSKFSRFSSPMSTEDFVENYMKDRAAEQKLIDRANKEWKEWLEQIKNYEENEKNGKL